MDLAETSEAEVISRMAGREVKHERHVSRAGFATVLRVENLSDGRVIHGVSLTLRRGEALRVAGLVGTGRTDRMRLVAGRR